MKKTILIFCCFMFLQTSKAEEKQTPDYAYRISQGILIGGAIADWISSRPAPHSREASFMGDNRGVQAAMVFGTTALNLWTAHYAHKNGKRNLAIGVNVGMGAVHGIAAGFNYRF